MRPVPASAEVSQHESGIGSSADLSDMVDLTLALHPCDREGDVNLARCPCECTAVISCPVCGEALFVITLGGTWCEHAVSVAEAVEMVQVAGEAPPWPERP